MKPHQILQLANYALEHGFPVRTHEERLEAKKALETILHAEIQGVIKLTRKEVGRLVSLQSFINKNLWKNST